MRPFIEDDLCGVSLTAISTPAYRTSGCRVRLQIPMFSMFRAVYRAPL